MIKLLCKIFLLVLTISISYADNSPSLGKISFFTSTNSSAQHNFEKAMLLLHSFEYNKARFYFQQVEKMDPNDVMAFWGEAMTYNHPIWNEQDLPAARMVLKKIAATDDDRLQKARTPQERGYLNAINQLYGKGDKKSRDEAYSTAMAALYHDYPLDDEIACFYALSLLGKTESNRDFATYMQAAAILEEVYARNPEHPGAAHYLIHSYDDAVHAPLGLRAARTYAKIAPQASHALHMPSHIFLALGMWDDVITSNKSAWEAGHRDRLNNSKNNLLIHDLSDDLHALQWLAYGYLQKQDKDSAFAATKIAEKLLLTKPSPMTKWYYVLMRAAYLSETQDWNADLKTVDVNEMAITVRANDLYVNVMRELFMGENPQQVQQKIMQFEKSIPQAAQTLTQVHQSYYTATTPAGLAAAKIVVKELNAMINLKKGDIKSAITLLQQACKIQDQTPLTYGIPAPIKPPHELLAKVLMQTKHYNEAYEEYLKAESRNPHRFLTENGLKKCLQLKTVNVKT